MLAMNRDIANRALIGTFTYLLSVAESLYVLLQVFNGDPNYYILDELFRESLGIVSATARNFGQSLMLGPIIMSGYSPAIIVALIIISNALIAIYTYRIGRLRGLSSSHLVMIVLSSLINASLLSSILEPWQPQSLAIALAIATYYYVDVNNRFVSTTLAILTAILSPTAALLLILIPITHWLIEHKFAESGQYVITIGSMAITYYMLANTYSLIKVVTVQGVINQLIYGLATTAFIQLTSLGTAIPALIATVLGGVGYQLIMPAVLIITLVEALAKLRDRRIGALVLGVSLLLTVLMSPLSPLWPPYQGIGGLGTNWSSLNQNATGVYELVSLAPSGRIEVPTWASLGSLMIKPGRLVVGKVTSTRPVNGTYAICGYYQLVINNYSGVPIINGFNISINELSTNSSSYTTSNEGLILLSGTYQKVFLIESGLLEIPPGTYVVSTLLSISPYIKSYYTNVLIPRIISTPLTSTVLPINAYSTVTFNLNLNFTGEVLKVIIYGVSYSEQQANLALTILRNGQVVGRATATAPPIVQGMKPYPIEFDVNLNVTPGTYALSIMTDQPLILYVTQGVGMNVISNNETVQYPGEIPTYSLVYSSLEKEPIRFTWAQVVLVMPNQSVVMNITGTGSYALKGEFTVTNWTKTDIKVLLISSTPVLPVNVTIGPITIESTEKAKCPIPGIIEALARPGYTLLMILTALPIAAALPNIPRPTISKKLRNYLITLGIALMLLFYIAWALGFTGVAPQLYNQNTLKTLAILFLTGLTITLTTTLTTKTTNNTEQKSQPHTQS